MIRPIMVALASAAVVGASPVVASVAVDVAVTEGYDSNLFRLSAREQAAGGFPSIDDLSLVPRAAAEIHLPIGLQTIDISASAGYRLHRYNTALDSFERRAAGTLRYRLPFACAGALAGSLTRHLNDYDDVDGTPRRIVVDERVAGGDVACAIAPDVELGGLADYRTRTNHDPILRQFDLDQRTVRGELAYGLPETIQPYAAVRYRNRAQPRALSPELPRGARATIWDAGGGARWAPSDYLRIDASGAWTHLRFTNDGGATGRFTGAATIDWDATGKTSFHLAADSGIDSSPNFGVIAFLTRGASARADWQATPYLLASIGGGYRHRILARDRDGLGPEPAHRETDRTWAFDTSLNVRLAASLIARAAVGLRDRGASFTDSSYRAVTATFGLSYRLAGPLEGNDDLSATNEGTTW